MQRQYFEFDKILKTISKTKRSDAIESFEPVYSILSFYFIVQYLVLL